MNTDQLAVERAAWAVALKASLIENVFSYSEHLNDYQTMFVVTRTSPGWRAVLKVCSAHGRRNRIEVNDAMVSASCKPVGLRKIMKLLNNLHAKHAAALELNKDKELAAARWQGRQEMELAGLSDLKGVDVEIIKDGIHAGCYCVKFQPGNALEHLSLLDFKLFHKFVQTLARN
jgi:hypothetical protein